ncbi:ABC transporter ATP-binding protein [Aquibium carbonis]|uniref:ABC transporter ATP-binding protein n=1 Tax=Aquibium carbonis TaxID=2495581 RepID=A0A429YZP5_9HYPH|nr:ABC transporter ATP-binding protein [Aquibium carbonis]RST86874.1 ABC transporter ATP-binding protein [Aquibium carbonis]
MASLEIDGVSKRYGDNLILDGVSVDVPDGAFLTLVGPSGCGKSTLLRILAGLELQDAGSLRIGGHEVSHLRPSRRDIAMVFQSYALYPHMTVAQNIAIPLILRRLPLWQRLPLMARLLPQARSTLARIDAEVQAAMEMLGLTSLAERRPVQLSGGQRQRVALGRALVRQPAVFLLDEPLSNLDAKLRVHMRSEIAQLHGRLGTTFVYVTHDQIEAMTMSTHVAVMMEGRLLQVATPSEIYADPADLRVAEFIGSPKINVLPARVGADGTLTGVGLPVSGSVAAAPGTAVQLGLRPEHLILRRGGGRGTVSAIEDTGPERFVSLVLDASDAPVVARVAPDHCAGLRVGDDVSLAVLPGKALVFDHAGARLGFDHPAMTPGEFDHVR